VQLLRKNKRAAGMDFKELNGKDHSDSFLLLESGRADAFVMDGQILAGLISKSKNPADFAIVGEVLSVEPIAIMYRKDDPAFKKAVDDSVRNDARAARSPSCTTSGSCSRSRRQHAGRPAGERRHQGGLGEPERQAVEEYAQHVSAQRRDR
jgi:hypothetical protein